MANMLKAYISKTIIDAARYAGGKRRTKVSVEEAFRDALQGVNSCWWTDLIYVNDVIPLAPRYRADILAGVRDFVFYANDVIPLASQYRADIRAAVRDFVSEIGAEWCDWADHNREITWADVIAATSNRHRVSDYYGHNGLEAQDSARALAWGLCFAVEYLAGELAREYCRTFKFGDVMKLTPDQFRARRIELGLVQVELERGINVACS